MMNLRLFKILVIIAVIFSFSNLAQASAGKQYQGGYLITDYGAVGDGKTLNTSVINKVIETCAKAGGGKVIIPPGRFLSGPIFLKSNINVEIQAGATLIANNDIKNCPTVYGRWEGIDRKIYASIFTGHDLENVSITGRGTIDGQGKVWWDAYWKTAQIRREMGIAGREPNNPDSAPLEWPRPRTINLYRCKNVLVRDITILNSPSWTVHPVYCEDVTVDNVRIFQPADSPNTDGVNPDSCKNVRIANCHIDVGDDCITIKSGYNEDGRRVGIPCENVVITNCTMIHGHGGVVIGSEMSGDVRNVTISNCVFDGTMRGLRIKTSRDRGGIVEDIRADNIVMRDITGYAFSITMYYEKEEIGDFKVTEKTPRFKNLYFSNISVVSGQNVAEILGLPEMPIENIQLRNIEVHSSQAGIKSRHTKGAIFDEMVVNTVEGPALDVYNASDMRINQFTTKKPHANTPVILLEKTNGVSIKDSGDKSFLELKGNENKDVKIYQTEYKSLTD